MKPSSAAAAAAAATRSGFKFWETALKRGTRIVAPMVKQSDLAWRILSRRYGADVCYTPMLNSAQFVRSAMYRQKEFQTCTEDAPLIAQFAGNDCHVLLQAAKFVERKVVGIDLNLGCPQNIARRGRYGSFLQDEWPLLEGIISHLSSNLSVPVTAKIRVFPDVKKTVDYAHMLEGAGAQLLTVHGRTREQKGQLCGEADWDQIKQITSAVNIPVFANGNIQHDRDIEACMQHTGAVGVMVAEANLLNPFMFARLYPTVWQVMDEYLNICKQISSSHPQQQQQHVISVSAVRGHVFKVCEEAFAHHPEYREKFFQRCHTFEDVCGLMEEFKGVLMCDALLSPGAGSGGNNSGGLIAPDDSAIVPRFEAAFCDTMEDVEHLPYWYCKSYRKPVSTYQQFSQQLQYESHSISHPQQLGYYDAQRF